VEGRESRGRLNQHPCSSTMVALLQTIRIQSSQILHFLSEVTNDQGNKPNQSRNCTPAAEQTHHADWHLSVKLQSAHARTFFAVITWRLLPTTDVLKHCIRQLSYKGSSFLQQTASKDTTLVHSQGTGMQRSKSSKNIVRPPFAQNCRSGLAKVVHCAAPNHSMVLIQMAPDKRLLNHYRHRTW
jgi:hypothetical protein